MTVSWVGNPKTWPATGAIAQGDLNSEIRDRMDWLKAADALHGITSATVLGQVRSALVGVRAYRSSAQTISDSAWTAIQFDAADDFDSDAMHSTVSNNTRVTFPFGTYALIGAWCRWEAEASGRRQVRLTLEGTAIPGAGDRMDISSGLNPEQTVVTPYQFSAGQYMEFEVNQNTGTSLDILEAVIWALPLFRS